MKVLIGVPVFGNAENECIQSIYDLEIPDGVTTELCINAAHAVDVNRSILSQAAIQRGCDYLFFVDSDVILPKDALKRLISHDKDIVTGVYRIKTLGSKETTILMRNAETDKYRKCGIDEIRGKGLIETDACGFGCVLIKTSVFKDIPEPWFVYLLHYGEDVFFCRKAINAGYKVYADTNVLCGHIGKIIFDLEA